MATHDPLLILRAHQRVIIRNGGIVQVIRTTPEEKELLLQLERIDQLMEGARQLLRSGKQLGPNSPLSETLRNFLF